MSAYLQQFAERFAHLDVDSLDSLNTLYSEDVVFRDPLHQIHGLDALQAYFAQLYANARDIRYAFAAADEVLEQAEVFDSVAEAIASRGAGISMSCARS